MVSTLRQRLPVIFSRAQVQVVTPFRRAQSVQAKSSRLAPAGRRDLPASSPSDKLDDARQGDLEGAIDGKGKNARWTGTAVAVLLEYGCRNWAVDAESTSDRGST